MTVLTRPSTIVEAVLSSPEHTTLAKAVQAAGLVGALSGSEQYTLFAPTDSAFSALPAGTLESLLAEPATLAEILKYHVVAGSHYASEVVSTSEYMTLEGHPIHISSSSGSVYVEGATVTGTDMETGNGVIHVIDSVLIPPQS